MLDALRMAMQKRQPTAPLLHHSDRGSHYASAEYQAQLAAAGFRCSTSRRGDCFDNAPVESFVRTLKPAFVYQQRFATRQDARQAIFDYVKDFRNRKRRHSALDYLSPVEYEERQRLQSLRAPAA